MDELILNYDIVSFDTEIPKHYRLYLRASDEAHADIIYKELFGSIKLKYEEKDNMLYITLILVDRDLYTLPYGIPKSEKSKLILEWLGDKKVTHVGVEYYNGAIPFRYKELIELSF